MKLQKINFKNQFLLAIGASLSLGLAPFSEPHILGKLKWLWGGARGMKGMDWFDLFLHGAPWIYLLIVSFLFVYVKIKNK